VRWCVSQAHKRIEVRWRPRPSTRLRHFLPWAPTNISHHVTFTVEANTHRSVTIGEVSEGDASGLNPANNAAITTLHLGTS
jgi:hypothetical protein